MNAKEVRIGNYLRVPGPGFIAPVKWITEHGIEFESTSLSPLPLSSCYGIKITQEWLIKFGFEKFGTTYEYHLDNGDFVFAIENEDTELNKGENDYWYFNKLVSMPDVSIQYIHELQNLYFALTGEELIKH